MRRAAERRGGAGFALMNGSSEPVRASLGETELECTLVMVE